MVSFGTHLPYGEVVNSLYTSFLKGLTFVLNDFTCVSVLIKELRCIVRGY